MKKYLSLIAILLIISSCDKEETTIDFSTNAFSFSSTQSFGDHLGQTRNSIYDLNNHRVIDLGIETPLFGKQIWESKQIYYSDGYSIIRYDPKSKESTILLSPDRRFSRFDYAHEKIVYSAGGDIFLVDLNTGVTSNITENQEGTFEFPNLSPKGDAILFNSEIRKFKEGGNTQFGTVQFLVYHMDNNSFQNVEMFDEFASPNYQPTWSPNGDQILYEQFQSVFTFDLSSEVLERITKNGAATDAAFSPDGKMIYYFKSSVLNNEFEWKDRLTIYDFETQTHRTVSELNASSATWNSQSDLIIFSNTEGIHSFDLQTSETNQLVSEDDFLVPHSVSWLY